MTITFYIRWPRLMRAGRHVDQWKIPTFALLRWLDLWCSQHKGTRSIASFVHCCLSSLLMRGRKSHHSRTIISMGNAQASILKPRGATLSNHINSGRSATKSSCGSRSYLQKNSPWNSTWPSHASLFIVSWKPLHSNLEYFLIIKSFSVISGILTLDKDPNKRPFPVLLSSV